MAFIQDTIQQEHGAVDDLPLVVGANLHRVRTQRGPSLERLAKASCVSRAMLGQIENGHSVPTISVLWKITQALGVTFSALTVFRWGRNTDPSRGPVKGTDVCRWQVLLTHAVSVRTWTARGVLRVAA